MKILKTFAVLYTVLILLNGCSPKVCHFNVSPAAIGPNDPISLDWKVRGKATLLIHDSNHPNGSVTKLLPITLLISGKVKTDTFKLSSGDTLRIPVDSKSELSIRKAPDSIDDDRIRNLTMVAFLKKRESPPNKKQVEVRPDTAISEIGISPKIFGDSVVAAVENNPLRWGDYLILTVANGSNRSFNVLHSNISREIRPGDPPESAFKGTSVKGDWEFRCLATPEEKRTNIAPRLLKILITVKRPPHGLTKH